MYVFVLDIIKQVIRQLRFNAVRSALATLGIMIGICALVSIDGIGRGTKDQIISNMANLGYATNIEITLPLAGIVQRQSYVFHKEDMDFFADSVPDVIGKTIVNERMNFPVSRRQSVFSGWIIGTTESYFDIFNLELKGDRLSYGNVRDHQRVCIIGEKMAAVLFPRDENPIGQSIDLSGMPFIVMGVLEKTTWRNYDRAVIVPVTAFQDLFPWRDVSEKMFVKISDSDKVAGVVPILMDRAALYTQSHSLPLSVLDNQASIKVVRRSTQLLQLFLLLVALITIVSGGIGIMNIQLASVVQRAKELAIKRTVGASTADIFLEILLESTVLGVFAGILGIFFGFGLGTYASRLVSSQLQMQVVSSFSVLTTLGIFVFSAILTTLFGFVPALKATRQDIILSLRSE